jgi:hypothetical protein
MAADAPPCNAMLHASLNATAKRQKGETKARHAQRVQARSVAPVFARKGVATAPSLASGQLAQLRPARSAVDAGSDDDRGEKKHGCRVTGG